jgi:type II secretion system protein N
MKKKYIIPSMAYCIYAVLAAAVFLYLLFPSEVVERHIISLVSTANPHLALSIGTVTPAFPPALQMKQVSLRNSRHAEFSLDADRITVSPSITGLLTGTMALNIYTRTSNGIIRGNIEFTDGSKKPSIKIRADGENIDVGACPWPAALTAGGTATGTMKGTVTYDGRYDDIIKGRGKADIILENGSLLLPANTFGTGTVDFDTVTASMTLKDGVLKIDQLDFSGRQLRGTLSGNIHLTSPVTKSRLSLAGKAELPVLGKTMAVTLQGTVDTPIPRMR